MGRYPGELTTDVYGENIDECKVAHIQLSATQTVTSDDDGLLEDVALKSSAQSITTFENDMPYARNITVVADAATAAQAKIKVYGTNLADDEITEEISLTGDTPASGTKAFKTVTQIDLPVANGTETVSVGWGEKLGLPFMMASKPLVFALDDGVIQSTAPTLTVDADELEKNTIDLNSDMDGSVIDIYMFI